MARQKKPEKNRWDPTSYWDKRTSERQWEEHERRMQSLLEQDQRRFGQRYVRAAIPERILDSFVVEHVDDVMDVVCWTYCPTIRGENGKLATLKTWFQNNLLWSIPYLMKKHGFQPCFKCKGTEPAKSDCFMCGSRGWLDVGSRGVESLEVHESKQTELVENLDGTLQPIGREVWLIDPQGACRVKRQWAERQSPELQELLRWIMNLPVARRCNLVGKLLGENVRPKREARKLSQAAKVGRTRKQNRVRKQVSRDLESFNAKRQALGLGNDNKPLESEYDDDEEFDEGHDDLS